MEHLPLFVSLRGRRVLVVGGGSVAARKIDLLRSAGANVHVVSPKLCTELDALLRTGELTWREGIFHADDLEGVVLAIAASDDREANAAVSRAARARAIWVNVVDDASLSTFIVPAIVDRAPVTVAIGTAGASPVLARRLRAQIEAVIPERIGELAQALRAWRPRTAAALPKLSDRRAFWERFLRGPLAQRLLAGHASDADVAFEAELEAARAGAPAAAGIVYLIGGGPGDPELLTLRAQRLLSEADVVVYDRLVSEEVLARARRDAERVFVGKAPGAHSATQEEINAILVEHARRGLRVARLKGGDPFIFGRGGEELDALVAAGVPAIVVPGITAALGAASQHGIPLTDRRHAEAVSFVTATGQGFESLDWRALAAPRQTVVFYMGIAQLEQIVAALLEAGAPATRPAAIVERATLPGERVVRATLAEIAARARREHIGSPALLIVGETAARDSTATQVAREVA